MEAPKFESGQMVRHKRNGKHYVVVPYGGRVGWFQMRPKEGFTAARYSMGGTGKMYGPQRHFRDGELELVESEAGNSQ